MNCSSKLQFCCDVNSLLGGVLLLWRGGDRVGVVTCFGGCGGGGPPPPPPGGCPGGPESEVGSLGSRPDLPSPKLLSAIEFMRFCGCGRMGGKLGGRSELRTGHVTFDIPSWRFEMLYMFSSKRKSLGIQ